MNSVKFSYKMNISTFISLILLWILDTGVASSPSQKSSIFDTERTHSYLKKAPGVKPKRPKPIPRTEEEITQARIEKTERMQERKERAKEKIREMIENPNEHSTDRAERMTKDDLDSFREGVKKDDPLLERPENRWLWNNKEVEPYQRNGLADPGTYWDMWSQAFRMLGVYVECSNPKANYYGNNNNNNNNNDNGGCQRWVIWAAYVNPKYQGFGISEYVGNWGTDDYYSGFNQYSSGGCQHDDGGGYNCYNQQDGNQNNNNNRGQDQTLSSLDCHTLNTDWLLLGVYRENFEDYFEQISKHMWYYSSYEYKVATNGLELLEDDCEGFGTDKYGTYLYKAPRPIQGGGFEIGLYVDDTCMTPYGEEGVNALNFYNDDGFSYANNNNKNNNNNNYYGNYYDWNNNQYDYGSSDEAVLELFNEVYEEFKYCTLCIDYPSYQDGYFNGEGYDEDDLINQCWKFYSHDTYECDTTCISLGSAQGTINAFTFGGKVYGTAWDGSSTSSKKNRSSSFSRSSFQNEESIGSRLAANFFLLMCALCFGFACYAFVNVDDVNFSGYFDSNTGKQSKLRSLLSRKEKAQVRIGARNDSDKKGPSMFSRMRTAPAAFVKKNKSKRAIGGDKQRGTVIDVKPRQKSKVSKKSIASDASYAESYAELKVYSRPMSSDNGRYTAPPPSKKMGKARIEIAKVDPLERLRSAKVAVEVGDHDYEPQMRRIRSEGANKSAISILNRHKQSFHSGGFADGADDRVKIGVRTSRPKVGKTNLNVVWEDDL